MPIKSRKGALAAVLAAVSLLAVADSRRASAGVVNVASRRSTSPIAEVQPASSNAAQPACMHAGADPATAEAPLLFRLDNATLEQHLRSIATPRREIIFASVSLPAGQPIHLKMVQNLMWHLHHVGRAANTMIISQHPSTCLRLVVCPGFQAAQNQLLPPKNLKYDRRAHLQKAMYTVCICAGG